MSAEEFTDTVFAKIDINGDGEGAEEGLSRGGVSRDGSHSWRGAREEGDTGPSAGRLFYPPLLWMQTWIWGIPAPDFGFWIRYHCPSAGSVPAFCI
jgi:hypothetical protein